MTSWRIIPSQAPKGHHYYLPACPASASCPFSGNRMLGILQAFCTASFPASTLVFSSLRFPERLNLPALWPASCTLSSGILPLFLSTCQASRWVSPLLPDSRGDILLPQYPKWCHLYHLCLGWCLTVPFVFPSCFVIHGNMKLGMVICQYGVWQ